MKTEIPLGLTWGENRNREPGQVHIEWHAPCGCAFHPKPFPHVHPCTNEHKRPDLHTLTEEPRAASPVAATVDAETPPFRHLVGSSRHPHFTAADHERMKKTLDALSEYPTEEQAEAVLQAAGTSGKEVVNGFIERLLRENLELKTKLNTARHYSCSCGGALTAEEYIEHYFEKGHDRGDPTVRFQAAAAEIVKAWLWHTPEHDQERARISIAAILSKHLGSAAVREQGARNGIEK